MHRGRLGKKHKLALWQGSLTAQADYRQELDPETQSSSFKGLLRTLFNKNKQEQMNRAKGLK